MSDDKDISYTVPHRPPTWSESGHRLWLYPERREGRYSKVRRRWAIGLLLIYFIVPFIEIQGHPLLRFDIEEGIIYAFTGIFRFNDGPYFIFILLSLAMLFFFTTTVKGRFWCGYTCPQTVFLEWIIRPIEELIEGKASKRRKSDKKNPKKYLMLVKYIKLLIFLAVASIISHAFMAYFVEPSHLWWWILGKSSDHWTPFIIVNGMTALLFFDFAWFREQFCSVLCPYMRFQTVLMDEDTPVIAYDIKRGEPRGKGGDCIDCDLCIKVCPTGIDIRDGLQLECIQCGRCADACDTIMAKQSTPQGLVRTATMNQIHGRTTKKTRYRPYIYGSAMVAVLSALIFTFSQRDAISLTFIRQPGPAYSEFNDGRYSNSFRMRLENNKNEVVKVNRAVNSPSGLEIICPGCETPLEPYEQRVSVIVFAFKGQALQATHVDFTNQATGKAYRLPLVYPTMEGKEP